ncbi:hypothetical protein [Halohasta salina]|uniref:hypothetical protein n=1 Tax=Halohasta salina TaxID=2961621 RepID=UPI0020A40912|nr:hypothetical protein [Halohasta salina]
MTLKTLGYAFAAGIAAFLVVGVTVTELVGAWIEFSLFVGLPAGIVAGALVAAAVSYGLGDGVPSRRRRLAGSVAGFGVGFLVAVVALGVAGVGVVSSMVAAFGVGLVAAVVRYLRAPPAPDAGTVVN